MASFTPAHIAAVRGPYRGSPSIQKQRQSERRVTMNKIKQLYLDRQYKNCAVLCEEAIKKDIFHHSLYKTFLHFFAAICYESLGLSAHNYSSNKLPFLGLAKDAFALASDTLPLPYSSNENGGYDSPAASPALTDATSNYDPSATSPVTDSPTPTPVFSVSRRSSAATPNSYQNNTRPSSYDVPNFDDYSPRQSIADIKSFSDEFGIRGSKLADGIHLSLKLDAPERESGLMPKPLVINKKPAVQVLDMSIPLRSLPRPPIPLRNPQRQTALQLTPHVSISKSTPSPTLTPIPIHSSLQAYLSSCSLSRYNTELTAFRTQLSTHLVSVEEAITQTMFLQKEHKANQCKRLASYWSFKLAVTGDDGEGCGDRKATETKERIERLRNNGWTVMKERYGWKGEEYYADLRRRAEMELKR